MFKCLLPLISVFLLFGYCCAQGELTPGVNCVRECDKDTPPLSCYYEFNVEAYEVWGIACAFCRPNVTNFVTNDCQCVEGDGVPRTFISVNRMLPGPGIYVCEGDKVIVDVLNRNDGEETSIHWHGILQKSTQFYDGMPYITQCPIHSGSTFRYQWIADQAGTYFYHSHSGLQKYNGMAGSLVVYQPKSEDPNGDHYDVDTWETVIILQDWKHERMEEVFPGLRQRPDGQEPASILINGKGVDNNYGDAAASNGSFAEFRVKKGLRYRFRLINAMASVCPASVRFEHHRVDVISTDAVNVEKMPINTIISMTGERYDFILHADQEVGTYWIQVRGLGLCAEDGLHQLAILRYEGAEGMEARSPPTAADPLPDDWVLNPVSYDYTEVSDECVPVTRLNNLDREYPILKMTPNRVFYIPFGIYSFTEQAQQEAFYAVNNYEQHSVNTIPNLAIVSNITFRNPSSPLLTQYNDIDPSTICNLTTCGDAYCKCTNVLKLGLGEVVDFFIVDTAFVDDLFHPIHLHGMKFYVLDVGYARDLNLERISAEEVRYAEEAGRLAHRYINRGSAPTGKDTIAVPTNGYAHLRLVADNPGFWFMHCHIDVHMAVGMDMVVQVGELSDMSPIPEGFPQCGNFKPAIH